jgi:hypothetical protein
MYIVCTPDEVLSYIGEDPDEWYTKWKYVAEDDLDAIIAPELWQYLVDISEERNPWLKSTDIPDSNRMTKRKTAAGYKINTVKATAFEDIKAPKQAKVIAKLFSSYEDGSVVNDDDIERLLHSATVSGTFVTKQPVMRIFAYYRKELLSKGVIALLEE